MTRDSTIAEMRKFIGNDIYQKNPDCCRYGHISVQDKTEIAEAYRNYFVSTSEPTEQNKMVFWEGAVSRIPSPNPLEGNLELLAELDRDWAFGFLLGLSTNGPVSGILSNVVDVACANK